MQVGTATPLPVSAMQQAPPDGRGRDTYAAVGALPCSCCIMHVNSHADQAHGYTSHVYYPQQTLSGHHRRPVGGLDCVHRRSVMGSRIKRMRCSCPVNRLAGPMLRIGGGIGGQGVRRATAGIVPRSHASDPVPILRYLMSAHGTGIQQWPCALCTAAYPRAEIPLG